VRDGCQRSLVLHAMGMLFCILGVHGFGCDRDRGEKVANRRGGHLGCNGVPGGEMVDCVTAK
jgi:hypothetical protein